MWRQAGTVSRSLDGRIARPLFGHESLERLVPFAGHWSDRFGMNWLLPGLLDEPMDDPSVL